MTAAIGAITPSPQLITMKCDEKASFHRNGIDSAAKIIEERYRHMEQQAQQAEARHAELLAIASNDLRNPLCVIMLASSMLARELTAPQQAEQLATIQGAAREMTQVIDDLLDAAAIDAGSLNLWREECDTPELMQTAVAAARALASARSCTVEARLEDDLPRVRVDRYRVLQVFSRLVTNALRFMPKNGSMTIGAMRQIDNVRFFVTDSGLVVPDSQRSLAFLRRPPRCQGACRATGLGMFVGKGIVEAHGGRIELTSDAEHGTTVSFTLPIMRADDEDPV